MKGFGFAVGSLDSAGAGVDGIGTAHDTSRGRPTGTGNGASINTAFGFRAARVTASFASHGKYGLRPGKSSFFIFLPHYNLLL